MTSLHTHSCGCGCSWEHSNAYAAFRGWMRVNRQQAFEQLHTCHSCGEATCEVAAVSLGTILTWYDGITGLAASLYHYERRWLAAWRPMDALERVLTTYYIRNPSDLPPELASEFESLYEHSLESGMRRYIYSLRVLPRELDQFAFRDALARLESGR